MQTDIPTCPICKRPLEINSEEPQHVICTSPIHRKQSDKELEERLGYLIGQYNSGGSIPGREGMEPEFSKILAWRDTAVREALRVGAGLLMGKSIFAERVSYYDPSPEAHLKSWPIIQEPVWIVTKDDMDALQDQTPKPEGDSNE